MSSERFDTIRDNIRIIHNNAMESGPDIALFLGFISTGGGLLKGDGPVFLGGIAVTILSGAVKALEAAADKNSRNKK